MKKKDPCKDPEYTYNHPDICCNRSDLENGSYYPEMCCGNLEHQKNYYNPSMWQYQNCCLSQNKITYDSLVPPKTFYLNTYYTFRDNPDFQNLIDRYCEAPICTNEEEFYWDYNNNQPSECCIQNPNSEYNERCQISCSIEHNSCNISSYFENNKNCCCELNEYKNTESCKGIPQDTWKDNLSCKDSPPNNTPFAGTDNGITNSNIQTLENVYLTDYKTLNEMKQQENIVISGTGFEYDIGVKHEVISLYIGSKTIDLTNEGNLTYETATRKVNLLIADQINRNIETDKINLKSSLINNPFIFTGKSSNQSTKYVLVNENINDPNTQYSNPVDFTIKYLNRGDEHYITTRINTKVVYTYNYNLTLEQKYIAKQNAKIATNITTETKKEYLDGGNKFYTELNTTTGIYDFYITIENSGLTGKLSSTNNGFSCQYGVLDNRKKEKECFDNNNYCTNNYYFRQISLNNPFPNREPGLNWKDNVFNSSETKVQKYITNNNENIYQKIMYEIKLDNSKISQIKNYNKLQNQSNKGYGWDGMVSNVYNKLDSISSFLDEDWLELTFGENIKDNRSAKIGEF